jgi:cell division septum initiation protein DivIVA
VSKLLDRLVDKINALETERDQLREQLTLVRERLENLAAGMEMSAATSAPSKKSEIETGCAQAVREIAASMEGSAP